MTEEERQGQMEFILDTLARLTATTVNWPSQVRLTTPAACGWKSRS